MRALVAGWFSFTNGHATAGDLLSRDVACAWLAEAGLACDVALAPPFEGGVDWRAADPADYDFVVFVCGPFQKGELEAEFLARFRHSRVIGLNLTMLVPLHEWNPLDMLIERDSSAGAHPDMVFAAREPLVPVVGVCLVEDYDGAQTEQANAAIRRLLGSRELAVVPVDTRLDIPNAGGLRTPAEVESLLARMDVVVTTRLHGAVLALKNGVPVIAIDPEPGGAKIRRQMQTIGWPVALSVDELSDDALRGALARCLTAEARAEARACRDRALAELDRARGELLAALAEPARWERTEAERLRIERDRTEVLPPEEEPAAEVGSGRAALVGRARALLRRAARRA